ncbi:phosphatidylinositol 3-kinase VPS34 [Aspergillus clavatus NRRL 1]|uniref:Phosphatidylinositol 3-kinase VPS34 n=1 Tax=Aspergillus clavatus (strain ATCC 1007 / CBS 513.65 / DSM 816 / NCTC 3887 / NRRL 1 / QM 1276 / 107) TaxID=344612 RepID=A1CAJ1_ASPCL|nr:phosphoinositide 3-kinase, putative [Aspergillus clavatus NRRL 1]EAW12759.1 phosphoinositide 3-kinase, putative [Aspergillus clavatus NRRL 1]
MEAFTFAVSTQVDFPIHIKIGSLEGKQKQLPLSVLLKRPDLRHIGSIQNPVSDLFVTAQLWSDSKPLGVPLQTPYKTFKSVRAWNEWLQLPMSLKDAPLNSQLAVTIWDLSPFGGNGADGHYVPFGGTTIPLFDEDGKLKMGRQKCKVYRHKAADGFSSTTTPSTPPPKRRKINAADSLGPSVEELELERVEVLIKKHEMGEIPRIDWMDQMVFRQLEKLKLNAEDAARKRALRLKAAKHKNPDTTGADGEHSDEEDMDDENFVLYVEFPRFDHPIVWTDHQYPPPPISSYSQNAAPNPNSALKPIPEVRFGPGIEGADGEGVIQIYDPEVGQTGNPCEDKHRRLIRSHRTGIMDRDLKPNPKIRDELNVIVSYEPTQDLTAEEKDLVWRFRYYLTREKRALTKFVKSVNWRDSGEAQQAVEILPKWTEIDVDDALELLGPTFDNTAVRSYAVERLRKADDEELLLYLLQLVQALKYEESSRDETEDVAHDSSLANFLISRAANNFKLGNYLHWYLMVECDDTSPGTLSAQRRLFARVEYYFMAELEQAHPDSRKTLLRQGELVAVLTKIAKDIRFARENRPLKIEKLKKYLKDPKNELVTIDPPLPLPLNPEVMVTGCFPDDSNVFKSSLSPLHITFKTSEGRKYPILFKVGDDLRQDQLVIQIIILMDRLLQKENLDLKLTPYRILATNATAGAVQFVPSTSLSAVSAKYKSVLAYLQANNPDENEPLGVRKETMDTYVKSCAGYCVITYLLGVGDRHLENLLLAPDGHFFHADFGFILGRDPKPFAPMMKLCKEMVEGMGGTTSPQYLQFKQYCFTAYTTLRKSANLILNLFSLMVDANIPDIRVEPDKAIFKVKERFHLEMTEEEAIRHFEQLISDSVNAIFGVVIDRLHEFVQGWRA